MELHPLIARTRDSLRQIGYQDSLLLPDYSFSDVMGAAERAQTIPLAAFAQEPTSYRTACFGVTLTTSDDPREIEFCRALGAPVVLGLQPETNTCHLWKMTAHGLPEARGQFSADNIPTEIIGRQEQWRPGEILRAKNIAFPNVSPQLDFYDVGLVAAIEADVHRKLNELLSTVVAQSREIYVERQGQEPEDQTYRALFRVIFRFMAAKLLGDRKHQGDWLNPDASRVLQAVDAFYNDPAGTLPGLDAPIRNRAWETIRTAIHFQNLSVEALAYVYENTFVDVSTRRTLGTHATPYEIAEYMVRALPIDTLPQEERTVFEPFCGAAPFLVAALGRLRELLPEGMSASERHDYFVRMLSGMEKDPFAREVAFHSLILADYPNSNGWHILEDDVFASSVSADKSAQANIVFCNPPYGLFDYQDKQRISPSSSYKDIEALDHALQTPPKMLGFVLPLAYLNGRSYHNIKNKIDTVYGNVDIIRLPDNVFRHSKIETVLLLAYGEAQVTPRHRFSTLSKLRYRDFRHTRTIEWSDKPLKRLWEQLEGITKLSNIAVIHRGIRFSKGFDANDERFVSDTAKKGFVPGLSKIGDFRPYKVGQVQYMTTEGIEVGSDWTWELPKIFVSAARRSRGQWVATATIDYDGLVCTQRFHAVWPRFSNLPLEVLAAVVNGPIANAWIAQQAGKRDSQVRFYSSIPVPELSSTATELITRYVDRYIRLQGTEEATAALLKIDAAMLDAYALSAEAESELLSWFSGARRPGVPDFTGYGPEFEQARAEYRRELAHFQEVERYQDLVDKTFLDNLTPEEAKEKERLSRDIDDYNSPIYALGPQKLNTGH